MGTSSQQSHNPTAKTTTTTTVQKSSAFPPFDKSLSEDEKVVQQFVNIIQSKLDSKELHHSLFQSKEKKLLKDCVYQPGAYMGALVGIVSFITLRRAPIWMMHHLQLKHFQTASNVMTNSMNRGSHATTTTTTTNTTSITTKSTIHPTKTSSLKLFQEGPILTLVGGTLDFLLATIMGTVAWMTSINKKHTLQTCASLPLLSGTSYISKTLCPEFVPLYKSIDVNFWKTYTDDTVQAIRQFSQNCETRRLYEERVMMEMGFHRRDIKLGKVQVDITEDIDPHWRQDLHEDQERERVDKMKMDDLIMFQSPKSMDASVIMTGGANISSGSTTTTTTRGHSRHLQQHHEEEEDWEE